MRSFLVFAVLGGLGLFYLRQKHNEPSAPAATAQPSNVATAKPMPSASVSEHDWMKRSLDRATAVRDQARAQTKEAQDP